MELDRVPHELSRIFAGRRWILVNGVSAGMQALIDQLRGWGAAEFLVVAGETGVGEQPDAETVFMPSPPGTVMEGFRRFAAQVADPPAAVRAAVDRFDPDRAARALGPLFGTPAEFLGRRLYGDRPAHWESLEDKTAAAAVWEEAGVAHAPSEVVDLADAPAAAARLAGELGTVWSADNTEGWHGGGEYTCWAADPEGAAGAVRRLRGRAHRVRVMPFLDGLPCSIHGVVTGDGVAALRPVELLILRRVDRKGFVYAGVANTWDPPSSLHEEMRSAARAVGEVLRRRTGHRGPFSIDGIATGDGFRPTELNPRFSIGYGIQAATVEALHGGFFVRALVEGDLDVRAAAVEEAIVSAADASRAVRTGVPIEGKRPRASMTLRIVGDEVERADDGAELELGPSPAGSFMFWKVDASRIRPGPPFGPHAAAAVGIAAAEWDLPLPAVEAAPDVLR